MGYGFACPALQTKFFGDEIRVLVATAGQIDQDGLDRSHCLRLTHRVGHRMPASTVTILTVV